MYIKIIVSDRSLYINLKLRHPNIMFQNRHLVPNT